MRLYAKSLADLATLLGRGVVGAVRLAVGL